MDILNKISSALEKVINVFLILALLAMLVVYFSAVFARFVLSSGITWAEEFTRYTNVALVMFGSAVAARYRDHINVSAVESALKNVTIKKALYIIQQLVFLAFFVYTAYVGFGFANSAIHVSPTMRIPMKFVYNMVSVACVTISFQTVVYILNVLTGKEEVK